MASKALAIKYRPKTWDDVIEQESTKIILQQQLQSGEVKHAYLFCGSAGTGKTTCARIFANDINHGYGNPIEMDAASNSGVDDVRNIIQQAKTLPLDSDYKVFIIDECHSISNTGWQAFLKLIEEPPARSIFIFCTTDPQKIPRTILSRVQRYDFQRISQSGIVKRLQHILIQESDNSWDTESIEYIAKIADGGMRDAISLMDKCLAYNRDLTLENVIAALGTVDYNIMCQLTTDLCCLDSVDAINLVEDLYNSGKDLKQFVKQYTRFVIDLCKLSLGVDWKYTAIPKFKEFEQFFRQPNLWVILDDFVALDSVLRYSVSVKYDIEAVILKYVVEAKK